MTNDFSELGEMVYSGRGITVGMTPDRHAFVGYTLTGRSPPSQARRLVPGRNTGIVSTQLIEDDETLTRMFKINSPGELAKLKTDISKGSRALIVYPAIIPVGNRIVVSNGAQTNLLYNAAIKSFEETSPQHILGEAISNPFGVYDEKEDRMIDITTYEPDEPNNTPRISACLNKSDAGIHIVRRRLDGERDDLICRVILSAGRAKGITTYSGGNEKPLLPFNSELLQFGIDSNDPYVICMDLYKVIGNPNPLDGNKVYRVAAAVMMMNEDGLETVVMNRADEVMGE